MTTTNTTLLGPITIEGLWVLVCVLLFIIYLEGITLIVPNLRRQENRRLYSNSDYLKGLYLSFVRFHHEYGSPVWDPYCSSHRDILENIQKFALRISYKAWKEQYWSLLERSGLQSLAVWRKFVKLNSSIRRFHFSWGSIDSWYL